MFGGCARLALCKKYPAEIVMRVRIIRPDLESATQLHQRLVPLTVELQQLSEIVVGIGLSRVDLDGAPQVNGRLFKLSSGQQHRAEIVVGGCIVRPQLKRLLILNHCLVYPSGGSEGRTEIEMRGGQTGRQPHGLREMRNRVADASDGHVEEGDVIVKRNIVRRHS